MRRIEALKLAAGIVSTALFLSIPSVIARADSFVSSEQGIAGISAILDNTTNQEIEEAYAASMDSNKEKNSLYENLAVCIADDYVNVRKSASTDSAIVGRLNRGCAANILKNVDGDWVKIKSGKVNGYIATQFLVIGEKAKPMVDKYATKYATVVDTKSLRVRDKKSTDASTLTLIPLGEKYVVTKEYDNWAKILLGDDDSNNEEYTGYVSKDFISIKVKFKYAMSMKEIKRQEEAIEAEKERKEKRAQQEAEKKEEQRRSANNSSGTTRPHNSGSSSSSSSSGGSNNSGSSSNASLRSQVVNYALKFVGNPYVWGGQSLTRGADCSGFVRAIYSDFGYSLPRTSRDQAAGAGTRVSESNLLPGDLIFYASGGRVTHVAMYIGNGKIVHAATSRQGIITSQYKYRDIYCIKRIIH